MPHLALAKYGKDLVRVARIVRNADGTHDFVEYVIRCLVEGDIERAWTHSDNTPIVATDSIKCVPGIPRGRTPAASKLIDPFHRNTCNVYTKTSPYVLQPEKFALDLGLHFVTTYVRLSSRPS